MPYGPAVLKLIEFPAHNLADLPGALRRLADQVEAGDYGDGHNLAWVVDCGNGRIELGLMGAAPEPSLTAHFLLALGMRRLEKGACGE